MKKKPNTPRSSIKVALRRLWLRSRERTKALKDHGYCCAKCNVKQSKAKGKVVNLEVHHDPPINWDGIIDLIIERLLNVKQYPLCKPCHKKEHWLMQNHVKAYMQHHGYVCQEEIMCEVCGKPAVDIHHKVERSVCKKHGIEQDCIENLIALDRDCHDNDDLKAKLKKECLELLKG